MRALRADRLPEAILLPGENDTPATRPARVAEREREMAKRKKINHPQTGQPVEGELVGIGEIRETPTYVTLTDGTVLRLRIDIVEAIRIDGTWDNDGNPLYQVRNAVQIMVMESPEHLRRSEATTRVQ